MILSPSMRKNFIWEVPKRSRPTIHISELHLGVHCNVAPNMGPYAAMWWSVVSSGFDPLKIGTDYRRDSYDHTQNYGAQYGTLFCGMFRCGYNWLVHTVTHIS